MFLLKAKLNKIAKSKTLSIFQIVLFYNINTFKILVQFVWKDTQWNLEHNRQATTCLSVIADVNQPPLPSSQWKQYSDRLMIWVNRCLKPVSRRHRSWQYCRLCCRSRDVQDSLRSARSTLAATCDICSCMNYYWIFIKISHSKPITMTLGRSLQVFFN